MSPTNALWRFKDGPQLGCGKQMILVIQSYLLDFQIMFLSTPYAGNDLFRSIEKEKTINIGFSKYVEFWKLKMCKDDKCTLQSSLHTWKTKKTSTTLKFNIL